MTSIVYTYKKLNTKVYEKDTNQKEWIKQSIESARKLNYTLELYTNDLEFSEGLDLDKVHIIDDEYQIWDSFKLWVLENRKDADYFLSDSDVIFNKKIPFDNNIDIYFDGIEIQNWNRGYALTMKFLKSKGISDKIDFWSYDKKPVYNVGILKINNQKLKSDYIKYWKILYSEVLPHIGSLNDIFITPIITQYLLTLLVNNNNYTYDYFTKNSEWPYNNNFYNHFAGFLKFKNENIIRGEYLL